MQSSLDSPIIASTAPWRDGHPLAVAGPWEAVWALPEADVWAVALGRRRVLEAGATADRQALASLFARARQPIHGLPTATPGPWFGGMAFDPARFEPRAEWAGFATARWVLPQALVWRRGGETFCTRFNVAGEPDAAMPIAAAVPETVAMARIIERQEDRPGYLAAVTRAVSEIGRGTLQKVVLARPLDLRLSEAPVLAEVLLRLAQRYPSCRLFLFRGDDGSVFCGSTPETLCRVRGQALDTDVLAGSRPPGSPEFDAKERAEHDVVAQFLISALEGLAEQVEPVGPPTVRTLANILHLHTPLRATLRPEVPAEELVLRLHPSPAVGGFPREPAKRFIAEQEKLQRGWYAGPVGAVGPDGLDLAVALRCAWLHGARARLYMGAGIVRGSVPQAEWEETCRKAAPMREALGGVEA